MKKIWTILLILVCIIVLGGCNKKNQESADSELARAQQIIALLDNYAINSTNGFDYSLEQKYNDIIVNAHTISVRLDNTNEIFASRIEYNKNLNENIEKKQYTEFNETTYFKNDKIASYENGKLVWNECTFDEFINVRINSFNIDINSVKKFKVSRNNQYGVLRFEMDDKTAAEFLEASGIKNLKFEIKTSTSYDKLISFAMTYSQNMTSTSFNFIPYFGNVNIDIPE